MTLVSNMCRRSYLLGLLLLALMDCIQYCTALSRIPELNRRRLILATGGAVLSSSSSPTLGSSSAAAASVDTSSSSSKPSSNSLASRLAQRDPTLLKNSIFNVPPTAQVYPDFMRSATWTVTSRFSGYLFPSTKIDKQRLLQNPDIPGFQKCSIVSISDIGVEQPVSYEMSIDQRGLDARAMTLPSQIQGYLGYPAVSSVQYDAKSNPNRISLDFVEYRTKNAERVELFCNARESESYQNVAGMPTFVCSEHIRQVTFSGGPNVGVARQAVTNYAHFWTWKRVHSDTLEGNVLTAAYLDPQDAMFFEEPSKPVVVYSHQLRATRSG